MTPVHLMVAAAEKEGEVIIDVDYGSEEEIRAAIQRLVDEQRRIAIPLYLNEIRYWLDMFHCRRCGRCCTQPSGPKDVGILLEGREEKVMARALGLSTRRFKKRYCVPLDDGKYRIRYPCPFYEDGRGCRIYAQRPFICRVFPLENPAQGRLVVSSGCREAVELAIRLFIWVKRVRQAAGVRND